MGLGADLTGSRCALMYAWSAYCGAVSAIGSGCTESDPANAIEAGLILPEPGHEQEWFDENRVRLAELGVTARDAPDVQIGPHLLNRAPVSSG